MPGASGGLPAPATAPATAPALGGPAAGPAPGPGGAAAGGQTIVATLDLVGQGLNPLSSKDSDALLGVISKIIAPHNGTVSSVRLGQVQVCAFLNVFSSVRLLKPHHVGERILTCRTALCCAALKRAHCLHGFDLRPTILRLPIRTQYLGCHYCNID